MQRWMLASVFCIATASLSSQTSSGIVYEIDTRLRPNGESGMLAISLDGFRDYEEKSAWVWEHQALTRARFVAGDAALGERFEALRKQILCQQRDIPHLRQEVINMRQKMFEAHGAIKPNVFDLKQGLEVDLDNIDASLSKSELRKAIS